MLEHAGIGTYIRNVVPRTIAKRPAWRFTLLAPRLWRRAPAWARSPNVAVVVCSTSIYSLGEQLELPFRTPPRVNVYWSPHYNIPLFSRAPLVVTVHDVAHLALADIHAGALRQLYATRMFGAVRARARAIMFDSAFTAREFSRLVGEPTESTVIHLGVDASWGRAADEPPAHDRPYLLFVGSVKPHKNLLGLLQAFESLVERIEHDLVIIGAHSGQRTIDTRAMTFAARLGSRVQFFEGVDDARLKRYVGGAFALVLPSLYEGFGLPALEAMAGGCPCIVSSSASLPEVCGDAALYCDPRSPDDIAAQIVRLVRDPQLRERLVRAGRDRAAEFDWDLTADRTTAVLERAMTETAS